MLAGDIAKAGLPAISGPNQLVIRFSSGYNPQYQTCADPTRLARIQGAVRLITAQPWNVRVEMERSKVENTVEMPSARATAATPAPDPLVVAVQTVFDARILKVDDGFGRAAPVQPARANELDESEPNEVSVEEE